jgi:SAM-dependent methyltransferase
VAVNLTEISPTRTFRTGEGGRIEIRHCAHVRLSADEMVTFLTDSGAEYDVVRKTWGFYATPSLNGRLLNFGLRAALIRNAFGKYYVFLVEGGHEADLDTYLRTEHNQLVRWLDNDADLAGAAAETGGAHDQPRCLCGSTRLTLAHVYTSPPPGEIPPLRAADGSYRREILRCDHCGHFLSTHRMQAPDFYGGAYVDATYGGANGIVRSFERVLALPPERSDNAGRVFRVDRFMRARLSASAAAFSVLDVGSGLCVFLHGMKQAGWACTALDPDPRAAAHARDRVGIAAVVGDFMTADNLGRHALVTFNKVLEHVPEPVAMLRRAAGVLQTGGHVWVELPDGEAARTDAIGFDREEFFIEHEHIFSAASVTLLASKAGFDVVELERLREPSSKYTLRAFLVPSGHPTTKAA